MAISMQTTFSGLKPYEIIRYQLTAEHGSLVGYVSRFQFDGRSHWYLWNDAGLHCEYKTRKAAVRDAIKTFRQS